jgi:hypothetical protein
MADTHRQAIPAADRIARPVTAAAEVATHPAVVGIHPVAVAAIPAAEATRPADTARVRKSSGCKRSEDRGEQEGVLNGTPSFHSSEENYGIEFPAG